MNMNKLSMGIGAISLELFFGDEWLTTVCMKTSWKIISRKVKVLCVMCMLLCTVLFIESRSLGLERKAGGRFHLQLHMYTRPIANKYREGNMKKDFEKRVKSVLKLLDIKRRKPVCLARLLHICRYVTVSWFPCWYIMHVCGVCCLACHLVLCISKMWMAWFFCTVQENAFHGAYLHCSCLWL